MLAIFWITLKHDLKIIARTPATWLHPILFFIILISLFGIALGFEGKELLKITPAILWVCFLLITLFSLENLFRHSYDEGTLEPLILSPYPLWWLLCAKSIALWLAACLPLILVLPLAGMLMQLSFQQIMLLSISLMLGSPAFIWLGMLGAALTLTMPRSGVFLGLLLLPLYIPLLILGESAALVEPLMQFPLFQLTLLAAISVISITLIPHATALALKVAMD